MAWEHAALVTRRYSRSVTWQVPLSHIVEKEKECHYVA